MIKENLNNAWTAIAIVIASVIIGGCMILSALILARSNNIMKEVLESEKMILQLANRERAGALRPAPAAMPLEKGALPGPGKISGVTAGNNPVKGNARAPVLMVEFSDFQCPFSKRFYEDTLPKIEKEYITTGKVRFAYRDFPLASHNLARQAALACRCAGKQDRYWQMFDKLIRGPSLAPESINKYAQELGLNLKNFSRCLGDKGVAAELGKDLSDAAKFGLRGTPAFFVNGRLSVGARPFEAFKELIEQELGRDK